ncbi:DUF1236 domain-containing protein [Paracoccus sp. 1_MG-2023]|uniref:DUF1236 domain-containing protein n=1 Tax=unclassified Paracoccus (in: a-proteobacteria) TaxID=2688777 RepID=UPI001C0842BA|nr:MULTISPECIES: DUF1236 domain-containing protein [unclassified Paracoccus (in: a-proteobacteria)]MBU2956931.1 DUF1236 domain-containing protein [Paracoccus sp. C2R09]MDO6668129.1 DUF1236 domain-containing protein [Paracoccus sp. 1_MG-2023]
MTTKIMMTGAAALLTLSGAAFAQQTTATASTDLNVRSGPGVQHEVIGAIPGGDEVNVVGCIDSANWCEVNSDEIDGWAYGDYLNVTAGDEIVSLYPNRQDVGIAVIEAPAQPDNRGQNTAVGGVGGAAMGALIGGPVGAVAGAALGSGAGAAARVEPAPEVTTYVTSNSVAPVFLEGEVVLGAGVPDTVDIYDIPQTPDYRYAQINGQTVLVDPNDRQIVYIYR